MSTQKKETQPETKPIEKNDIRLSMNSVTRNVIRYCNGLLKEKTCKFLHFSAVGGSIGKLVSVVEVLKVVNPGLYQFNKFATVSYVPREKEEVKNQRLFPKMEVILSLEPIKEKNDGFHQGKIEEKERQELYNIFNEQIQRRGFRRGGFKGGFRGRRGFRRGGFRGRRGFRRGGFRGMRRGGSSFRYRRGGVRGGSRGSRIARGSRGTGRAMRGGRGTRASARGVRRGNTKS